MALAVAVMLLAIVAWREENGGFIRSLGLLGYNGNSPFTGSNELPEAAHVNCDSGNGVVSAMRFPNTLRSTDRAAQ